MTEPEAIPLWRPEERWAALLAAVAAMASGAALLHLLDARRLRMEAAGWSSASGSAGPPPRETPSTAS